MSGLEGNNGLSAATEKMQELCIVAAKIDEFNWSCLETRWWI
jgi:hypothetical protein